MRINKKIISILGFYLFLLLIIIAYSKNYILLGGEGDYFINTLRTKNLYDFSWIPNAIGTGWSNPILNFTFPILDIFYWFQSVGISLKIINTFSIFLIYALPFTSMFLLLSRILKVNFRIAFLLSLFYVINPFSTYHLQGMMFWNTAPLFVFPAVFGILYKYYFKSFKLFFVFGIFTAFFAYSFANIPYLGLFHIFLVISIILIYYLQSDKFNWSHYWIIIKNLILLEIAFILFNAWWFINLLRVWMQDIGSFYTKESAIDWASNTIGTNTIIERIFTLKMMSPFDKGYFFSDYYNNGFITLILFIPFLLIIWGLFTGKIDQKNKNNKVNKITVFFLLLIFFLNKGINKPFENIYLWLMQNIPFFIIFKSPFEKFSILLVFLITISLIFVFRNYKNGLLYYLFIIYLIVCSIPYITLNFIPDFKFENGKYISRHYLYKENYFKAGESLNNDKLDYTYLSLPGSLNYQVTELNHDHNKYYRGMDPFVYSVNKPFIAAYSNSDSSSNLNSIFYNFSNIQVEDILLDIYGIKKIVINRNIYPAFGFREKENVQKLVNIFSKISKIQTFGSISIFNRSDYLPRFYIPKQNIITNERVEKLGRIASESGHLSRVAFFFNQQNKNYNFHSLNRTLISDPTVEFKNINPTKYRVIVHHAKGLIPLVFSQSYHEGWKIYLSTLSNHKSNFNNQVPNYNILSGNGEDQVSPEELQQFINHGFISTLGNGKEKTINHLKWDSSRNIWLGKEVSDHVEKYTIDFISKNFQGTIQNNNLPDGMFWETWFKKPIENNKNHLMVNGYANSWLIDTNKICSNSIKCTKNSDGSYDFEVIVEFWPQRLYYLGLGISLLTLFGSTIYLLYGFSKRKNTHEI